MSFHFPTKNSQILLDFRPNPGEPSLKRGFTVSKFVILFHHIGFAILNLWILYSDWKLATPKTLEYRVLNFPILISNSGSDTQKTWKDIWNFNLYEDQSKKNKVHTIASMQHWARFDSAQYCVNANEGVNYESRWFTKVFSN